MKKTKETDVKDEAEIEEEKENDVKEESAEQKLATQLAETNDRYMRTLAEYDNFRKRTAKEKAGMYNDGVADTVEKLLPVIDNFERAVTSAADKDDAFFKGVDMILKQLQGLLKNLGVEEIAAQGEAFDANLHYAVAHGESDEHGENVVTDVMQKGYKLGERVIRPAMVKVAN